MLRGDFAGKNKVIVTVDKDESDGKEPSLSLEATVVESGDPPEPVTAGHGDET